MRNLRLRRSLCGFGVVLILAAGFTAALAPSTAQAARCGKTSAGFNTWLKSFKREAAAQGISQRVIARSLNGVRYNKTVIRLDRNQKSFKLSFKQFLARRVSKGLIKKGRRMMKTHARTLRRVERRYGVPGSVLVAIWGLETGYGANSGKMAVMRSLATLAYDCRRSAFFTDQLMSALKIVQRGDMTPKAMRGAWAGELGQTQFLATSYLRYAVDFDGNGRRDLIRSVPDVLGSTANYLKAYGWRKGQRWDPGTANYGVIKQWNKANVYARTIAHFANQLQGR